LLQLFLLKVPGFQPLIASIDWLVFAFPGPMLSREQRASFSSIRYFLKAGLLVAIFWSRL
jgi:hypothetical protein